MFKTAASRRILKETIGHFLGVAVLTATLLGNILLFFDHQLNIVHFLLWSIGGFTAGGAFIILIAIIYIAITERHHEASKMVHPDGGSSGPDAMDH